MCPSVVEDILNPCDLANVVIRVWLKSGMINNIDSA
jgi:hypothetical protein